MGGVLAPGANRAPTVKVKEGTRIAVLVAHDLDFAGTPAWR
jgi:type IV secretion system protein VirB10